MSDKPEEAKDKTPDTSDRAPDLFNSAYKPDIQDSGSQDQGTQAPSG